MLYLQTLAVFWQKFELEGLTFLFFSPAWPVCVGTHDEVQTHDAPCASRTLRMRGLTLGTNTQSRLQAC